jgi:imidazoleglycerol phosphate dehydratase HisB
MKSSSKLHHTRETIAIHYGRLLNETNQLNELCRFLKLNIPFLESEQQKLKIRFS